MLKATRLEGHGRVAIRFKQLPSYSQSRRQSSWCHSKPQDRAVWYVWPSDYSNWLIDQQVDWLLRRRAMRSPAQPLFFLSYNSPPEHEAIRGPIQDQDYFLIGSA